MQIKDPQNILRSVCDEGPEKLTLEISGVQTEMRLLVASDLHCNFDDDRGIPFQQYTARMNRCSVHRFSLLEDAIQQAQQGLCDAILLPGDLLSFPSAAGVEKFAEIINGAPVPCLFTAGNHDWHYEGMPGPEKDLRAEWIGRLLRPLYGTKDPLMYAETVKGLKFLVIDNSTYEILPEQLEFLKKELTENIPAVLVCHIPLYVPGRSIFFGCGHPDWNAANDPYFEIERRERWRAEGHTETTMEFYRTIMESPRIAGIIAGHIHRYSLDLYAGKFQAVAPNDRLLEIKVQRGA